MAKMTFSIDSANVREALAAAQDCVSAFKRFVEVLHRLPGGITVGAEADPRIPLNMAMPPEAIVTE